MKIHITLEHNFGHPDNKPAKSYLLQVALEALEKFQIKSDHWYVTKIEIE